MSRYKSSILSRFGLGCVEVSFDEMPQKKGSKLPDYLVGQKVHIRKLSPKQYEAYILSRMDAKTREFDFTQYPGMRAELVSMCLCDPDGNQLFGTTKEANEELTNDFVKHCFELCQWVNGGGAEAQEEAEKN